MAEEVLVVEMLVEEVLVEEVLVGLKVRVSPSSPPDGLPGLLTSGHESSP